MNLSPAQSSRCSAPFCVLILSLVIAQMQAGAAAPPEMVRIPAGETRIGTDQGRADEQPSFIVRVAAFEMDRTPVTVAAFADFVRRTQFVTEAERRGNSSVMTFGTGQWRLVEGANWRKPVGPKGLEAEPGHPVTHVSWNDAAKYCAASGKRLPSETEWEHAARAGSKKANVFAFGDELIKHGRYRANVWTGVFPVINTADDGYRTTSPVGVFGAGPLGLTDMAGNGWQWTSDWYKPYSEYAPHPTLSPQVGRGEKWNEKVQRGGSFLCDPKFCYGFRVTARGHATPESSHMHAGFRCVKSLDERAALRGETK